ncbi:MAG: haloacid dehalogenase, partial [Gammaproteobacteria bacterium]
FATALQRAAPPVDVQDLDSGETLLWDCRNDTPVQKIYIDPPCERQPRHKRKYAQGDLGPESSFYFHGPEQTLKLRANNLITFLQLADGVDDATWEYHLRRGDYSNWFRTSIKDPQLAKAAQQVERDTSDRSPESRSRIRAIVKERYTGSV